MKVNIKASLSNKTSLESFIIEMLNFDSFFTGIRTNKRHIKMLIYLIILDKLELFLLKSRYKNKIYKTSSRARNM